MKTLLFVFFMLFATVVLGKNAISDYESITGIVTTSDGYPAVGVSVLIKNTRKGAVTDDTGNFELKKIKPGTYTLVFSSLEYIHIDTIVQVTQNNIVFLKIQLQSTVAQLKNIIVTANFSSKYVATKPSESLRLNVPLIEVPQNIIVIPHQLLIDQGLVSMTQAIRAVSGIGKTYGDLNDYSLNIRGTDATYNVFRNGVGGDWWNQQEDVAMVEKIEFVKGPAGFMVSLAEPGGVINVVTKQPSKERIASVDMGFGSYNMMRLTTDLGGTLTKSGKLYYRFNAGIHKQRRDFRFGRAIRYFICPALTYEFNKKTSATFEYNHMYGKTSGNNNGLPAVDGQMFVLPRNFAVATPANDAITSIDNYYRLKIKHDFNDNWHLNIQTAYVSGPWDGAQLYSIDNVPISNDTLYRSFALQHYINYAKPSQAFLDGKFKTGRKIEHKVLFGLDYHNEGSKGSGSWTEKQFGLYIPNPDYYIHPDSLKIPISPPVHAKTRWIALYIQDHVKIAKKLIITLAGHLTHASNTWEGMNWIPEDEKKIVDNAFAPRAGLTWLFGDNVSVYVLYDQGFLPQSGRSFEHKRFKPVTGYNIETGLKANLFGKKLSLNFSIFDIVKNNVLTADLDHPQYQIQTGQIVSRGIDFDMTGNITPSLIINANYEYIDAKVTKESNLNSIGIKNFLTPDHRVNLWLQYKLLQGKLKNFSFSMGYQYTGKRGAVWYWQNPDRTKVLPAYSLLDAAISYSNEKFNIGFNIYNITRINYATIGYFHPTGGWKYIPGEPVNFRLSFGINLVQDKKDRVAKAN